MGINEVNLSFDHGQCNSLKIRQIIIVVLHFIDKTNLKIDVKSNNNLVLSLMELHRDTELGELLSLYGAPLYPQLGKERNYLEL